MSSISPPFENNGFLFGSDYAVEQIDDIVRTDLHTLLYVTARVEVVVISRNIFKPCYVVRHYHICKLSCFLVCRACVQSVRRMGYYLSAADALPEFHKSFAVLDVEVFSLEASRVPCEKLKRIRTYRHGLFAHMQKAL